MYVYKQVRKTSKQSHSLILDYKLGEIPFSRSSRVDKHWNSGHWHWLSHECHWHWRVKSGQWAYPMESTVQMRKWCVLSDVNNQYRNMSTFCKVNKPTTYLGPSLGGLGLGYATVCICYTQSQYTQLTTLHYDYVSMSLVTMWVRLQSQCYC